MDVIYLSLLVLFFAITVGLVYGLDRIRGRG